MIAILRIYIIPFLFLSSCFDAVAQWREPRLIHLGPEEGLSSWTFEIAQDSTGYMYFGTDQGLVRYDGNSFELFAHIPDDDTSIGPGDVWCLSAGTDNQIWIGTRLSGLNVFNPKTRKFKQYPTPNKSNSDYDPVFSVYADEKQQVWVGGENYMLHQFDKTTETFQTYRPSWVTSKVNYYNGRITHILPDHFNPNILWLSIIHHHPDFRKETITGLVSFNTETNTFEAYPCWGQPKYQDSEGDLWLATRGVSRFQKETKSCINYPISLDISQKSSILNIKDIIPYKGELILTSINTILSFSDQGKITTIANDKALGIVEDIYLDAQKNLWFGRTNGVSVLSSQEELIKFYSLQKYGVSERIYPGRMAYDASTHTLFVADHANNSTQRKVIAIPLDSGQSRLVLENPSYVSGLVVDQMGKLWVSGKEMNILDLKNNSNKTNSINLPCIEDLPSFWNLSLSRDGWIGGVSDSQFVWFNNDQGACHVLNEKDFPIPHSGEYTSGFQGMTFTNTKKALVFSSAIYEVDLNTASVTRLEMREGVNPYPTIEINSVIQDHIGHIWVATLAMTAEFERRGDSLILVKKYSIKDGLGCAWVHELYPDIHGRIWAFAQNGLNAIDPINQEVRQFGVKEGLSNPYSDPRQVITLHDGSISTVNGNGIIVFHPDSLWNGYTPLNIPIVLKEIRTSGVAISFSDDVNSITVLDLKPHQDNIDVQFQGLGYPTDYNLTYSYKVEGLNNDWISIGENKIVTLSSLSPGRYTLKIKAGAASSPAPVKALQINLATPLPQKPWFIALVFILIATILYAAYRWRIRNIRNQEEEKLLVTKRMADLELKALRSQMNPHFMFNSLNSIKNYILQAEPKLAAEYLSNFSHLIRMILQNSGEKVISLQEELETLILYIELERIRFENKFEFNCIVEDGLRLDSIYIPPMILQPYVENAIWHGLMHKAETGHLLLKFSKDGNMISCMIDDDGIGRKKSAALKNQSSAKYKSMGMGITKDRIDILNKMNSLGISAEIKDKVDSSGEPSGTSVIVRIPDANNEAF